MHRTRVMLLVIIMLCGVFAGGWAGAAAQETTPVAGTEHPLVGAWMVDTEPENPTNAPHLSIVSSDGTYLEVESDGTSIGVWEATGADTASITFHFFAGPTGMGTIRGDVEVAPDGQSWTASYTLEFIGPDGTSTGEIGPGMASATRLMVESQGTPVVSFEEFFGAPPATPEATPAG